MLTSDFFWWLLMIFSSYLVGVFLELLSPIFGRVVLVHGTLRSFERECNFWSSLSLVFLLVEVFKDDAAISFC
jgi:hypothetical protein